MIEHLPDADPTKSYVRRMLRKCITRDLDTGEIVFLPQVAFKFDPDLSIHQKEMIIDAGATLEDAYEMPPNGAVSIPVLELMDTGAHLKHTPVRELGPVLGASHHSIFGRTLTPHKSEKAALRDMLEKSVRWIGQIPEPA
ncbi:MAG: hypothetical protein LBE05_05650 [Microbacterium sp.]|nr:hypothetical protein [Microbacterium sp.]